MLIYEELLRVVNEDNSEYLSAFLTSKGILPDANNLKPEVFSILTKVILESIRENKINSCNLLISYFQDNFSRYQLMNKPILVAEHPDGFKEYRTPLLFALGFGLPIDKLLLSSDLNLSVLTEERANGIKTYRTPLLFALEAKLPIDNLLPRSDLNLSVLVTEKADGTKTYRTPLLFALGFGLPIDKLLLSSDLNLSVLTEERANGIKTYRTPLLFALTFRLPIGKLLLSSDLNLSVLTEERANGIKTYRTPLLFALGFGLPIDKLLLSSDLNLSVLTEELADGTKTYRTPLLFALGFGLPIDKLLLSSDLNLSVLTEELADGTKTYRTPMLYASDTGQSLETRNKLSLSIWLKTLYSCYSFLQQALPIEIIAKIATDLWPESTADTPEKFATFVINHLVSFPQYRHSFLIELLASQILTHYMQEEEICSPVYQEMLSSRSKMMTFIKSALLNATLSEQIMQDPIERIRYTTMIATQLRQQKQITMDTSFSVIAGEAPPAEIQPVAKFIGDPFLDKKIRVNPSHEICESIKSWNKSLTRDHSCYGFFNSNKSELIQMERQQMLHTALESVENWQQAPQETKDAILQSITQLNTLTLSEVIKHIKNQLDEIEERCSNRQNII